MVSSDDKYIFSGSTDYSLKVFDISTKQQIHHFKKIHSGNKIKKTEPTHNLGWIFSVAVSNNNKYIVTGSEDRSIKVLNLELEQESFHIDQAHNGLFFYWLSCLIIKGGVSSVCFSKDNRYIISGSYDKSIKIIHAQTNELLHTFERAHSGMLSIS